jgi:tRNA nucleotidyltransferase (CCA-adding enzyme)
MCRKLDDGSYRYCPSRLRRSTTYVGRGSDAFALTPDGRVQHAVEVTPVVATDGFVFVAHTGAVLSPASVEAFAAVAQVRLPAKAKFRLWSDIAAGSSVSGALSAMKSTGHLAQFPELAALDGVEQDPYWHPEGDALTHVGMAGDHMTGQCETAGIHGDDRTLLVLAATFHDLGKATHTHVEDDGRITSHGHDDAGVAPAHRLLAAMDAPKDFHDQIEPLIREHMCAATVKKPNARTVARLRKRLSPATVEQWVRVVNADHAGRGEASVENYAENWRVMASELPEPVEKKAYGLISSRDVLAAGMKPSPEFGAVLDAARRAEDDGLFSDEESARAWLVAHLAERG